MLQICNLKCQRVQTGPDHSSITLKTVSRLQQRWLDGGRRIWSRWML